MHTSTNIQYFRNSDLSFGSFGCFGSFWSFGSFWGFGSFGGFGGLDSTTARANGHTTSARQNAAPARWEHPKHQHHRSH